MSRNVVGILGTAIIAVYVPLDLNEDNEDDDTSDIVIAIRRIVSIEGGVTNEFLKNTIQLWAGMLLHSLGFFEGPAVEVEEE